MPIEHEPNDTSRGMTSGDPFVTNEPTLDYRQESDHIYPQHIPTDDYNAQHVDWADVGEMFEQGRSPTMSMRKQATDLSYFFIVREKARQFEADVRKYSIDTNQEINAVNTRENRPWVVLVSNIPDDQVENIAEMATSTGVRA